MGETVVGEVDGFLVGEADGEFVGDAGSLVGDDVVGGDVGDADGFMVGDADGSLVGEDVVGGGDVGRDVVGLVVTVSIEDDDGSSSPPPTEQTLDVHVNLLLNPHP